jgi:hypothetical protein
MRYLFIFSLLVFQLFLTTAIAQTFTKQITSSTDDAEEKFDGSYVTATSSDLELVYDTWNSQGHQKVGLRFTDVLIPSSATITNAYIQFTADGASSGSISLTIKGEKSTNANTYSHGSGSSFSNRPQTTSSVEWVLANTWSNNQAGENQRTPNLATVIEEVITSNNWQIGNSLAFIITGTGDENSLRRAFSYDGSPAKSAVLVIEYTSNIDTDLGVTTSLSPSPVSFLNPTAIVQVELFNYGNLTATDYTVSFTLNGDVIATEIGVEPIASGETNVFTFATPADLTNTGSYDLTVSVGIDGDENMLNNTIFQTIEVVNEIEPLFFEAGSSWKYWDMNNSPGTLWNTNAYNDENWSLGLGHMGFGDGDEQTVLNSGFVSYYFRKNVQIDDLTELNDVYIHLVHDEAAIVYINGQEVVRSELMPLGAISHTTAARQTINSSIENDFFTYKIDKSVFVEGINSIAISVRNRSTTDDDVSFDCYFTTEFDYSQDGPYVFYENGQVVVQEVTPSGLQTTTYEDMSGVELTCYLPHMDKSFSFTLKSELTIEPSTYSQTPSKFLTISDFDGHIEGLTMVLTGEGIIDEDFNWIYGDGHLIISGDLFDRGFHITESLWLLYKLENEAIAQGGKVHLVIGNHEMMNLRDDWRYVEVKYFNNAHLLNKRMLDLYGQNSEIGRWLRTKNIIERIGEYVFLHGGLSPQVSALDLTYEQINDYGRLRMDNIPCPTNACTVVNGSDGVYWYRGMANEELTQTQVDDILEGFEAKRVIMGHTKGSTVRALYQGKVLAIDMYHINNFANGYMEALQFELGCFHIFRTTTTNQTYTQLGDCDEYIANLNIEDEVLGSIQIYPNPTTTFLYVKIPKELESNYDYTIIDVSGQVVGNGRVSGELSMIDIQKLAVGKYILKLSDAQKTIQTHFLLKN